MATMRQAATVRQQGNDHQDPSESSCSSDYDDYTSDDSVCSLGPSPTATRRKVVPSRSRPDTASSRATTSSALSAASSSKASVSSSTSKFKSRSMMLLPNSSHHAGIPANSMRSACSSFCYSITEEDENDLQDDSDDEFANDDDDDYDFPDASESVLVDTIVEESSNSSLGSSIPSISTPQLTGLWSTSSGGAAGRFAATRRRPSMRGVDSPPSQPQQSCVSPRCSDPPVTVQPPTMSQRQGLSIGLLEQNTSPAAAGLDELRKISNHNNKTSATETIPVLSPASSGSCSSSQLLLTTTGGPPKLPQRTKSSEQQQQKDPAATAVFVMEKAAELVAAKQGKKSSQDVVTARLYASSSALLSSNNNNETSTSSLLYLHSSSSNMIAPPKFPQRRPSADSLRGGGARE